MRKRASALSLIFLCLAASCKTIPDSAIELERPKNQGVVVGETLKLNLRVNGAKPEAGEVKYKCVSNCPNGLKIDSKGTLYFTPTEDQVGGEYIVEIEAEQSRFRDRKTFLIQVGKTKEEVAKIGPNEAVMQAIIEGGVAPINFDE